MMTNTCGSASSFGDALSSEWLQLIRSEYLEMPGLSLTLAQGMRLWNLDERTCRAVLDSLVSTRFLARTGAGAYRLPSDDSMRSLSRSA